MKHTFIALALLVSANVFAQKVSVPVKFEKGKGIDVTEVLAGTQTSIGESTINATVVRHYDVQSSADGKIVLEYSVKSMKFEAASMMGSFEFDSEKESDRKGDIGTALASTLNNKYILTLDANGRVTENKPSPSNPAGKENIDPMMGNMLKQFSQNILPPAAGSFLELCLIPNNAIAKGDNWSDSTSVGKTVYTVSDITASEVILSFQQAVSRTDKSEMMGNEITVVSNGTSTGTIKVDRASGLLKEKTAASKTEGTMSAMGQTMPTSSDVQQTIMVK